MNAVREDSLMFSLEQIFEQQRDRVDSDRQRREQEQQKREEQRRERAEAARQARLTEQRCQLDAEAEREQQRAEQQARLLAMQQAAVARARAEVEARAQLEVNAARQRHEQALAAIKSDARLTRSRWAAGALAAFAVAAISGTLLFASRATARHEHESNALVQDLATARGHAQALEAKLQDRTAELSAMRQEVADLRLQLQRRAPGDSKHLERPGPAKRPPKPTRPPRQPAKPPQSGPASKPCVDDGDPLNPCL